jgi:predicted DNA-binding transcriptional regulator YafY
MTISVLDIRSHLKNDYNIDKSIRTIQRDIQTIETVFGINNIDSGWCWSVHAKAITIPGLTMMQALTFNLANSYLSTLLPSSTLNELQPFFDQANSTLINKRYDKLINWKKKIAVIQQSQALLAPNIDLDVHHLISNALLNDQQVKISYIHSDDTEMDYLINPLGLVLRNGITYLIAQQPENNYVQIFSLHRIKKAIDLYTTFFRDQDFELQKYIKKEHIYFGNFHYNSQSSRNVVSLKDTTIKVTLIFTKNAFKYLSETPLSEDQTHLIIDHDHIQVTATIQYTEQLIWWLRGYGSDVEVIEPTILRDRLIEDIEQLNRQYKIN